MNYSRIRLMGSILSAGFLSIQSTDLADYYFRRREQGYALSELANYLLSLWFVSEYLFSAVIFSIIFLTVYIILSFPPIRYLVLKFANDVHKAVSNTSETSFIETSSEDPPSLLRQNREYVQEIVQAALEERAQNFDGTLAFSAKERKEVFEKTKEKLLAELENEAIDAAMLRRHRDEASMLQSQTFRRMSDHVRALGFRANLNLFFGVSFSLFGLTLLYSFLQGSESLPHFVSVENQGADGSRMVEAQTLNWAKFIEFYLPRLSLVVIVELVSFYFLRLYSRAISELRYVQNEITTVEMRVLGLLASNRSSNSSSLEKAIESLLGTDRNSVISKDQTTVDIERDRATAEANSASLDAITKLLHGNEKGWLWKRP